MKDEKVLNEIENEQSPIENNEEFSQTITFKVNIPEEEIAEAAEEVAEAPAEKTEVIAETEEAPAEMPEETEKAETQEETEVKADTVAVPAKKAVKPQANAARRAPAKAPTKANPQRRRTPAVSQKQLKEEKKAKNTVVILACIMAVITFATCIVGTMTDVFKGDDLKAVAVLILPQEDKEELEKQLAKLWPLVDVGFDTEKMSGEELFSYIMPYSENGLYASFGYKAKAVTHEADPAGRFSDANGNYHYLKIPREEIDSILSHFGLEQNHALNGDAAYYYDAHYYFSYSGEADEKSSGKVKILDSKRIPDGRYYVTAKFGKKDVYITASMISDGGWEIHSMSLTPVFDSMGVMIKNEETDNSSYEMRQTVIEGKAKDGTVFRKYIIKYPYFFGESQGEIEANNFYNSVITYYQHQSQQIQSEYNKFKKKGGKTDSLPLEIHYTAQMSYSDEKNLCLINEITESVAMYKDSAEVKLPVKTVECNTFDVETGMYASKDNLIGKDYITVEKILYRIYCGYSYEALIDSSVSDVAVPADTYKLGAKIYNSASTFCKDGYVFCYIGSDGLREDVVIPFDAVAKLTAKSE